MPSSLTAAAPGIIGLGLIKRVLLFFLIWPGINYGAILTVLHATHQFNWPLALDIAIINWAIFTVFALLIATLEYTVGRHIRRRYFWLNLISHVALIVLAYFIVRWGMGVISEAPAPQAFWLMPFFLALEVGIYIIAIYLVMQRDHSLHLMINLKQAEIETLRSQSNPHFLFNTLNLIATETTKNPQQARDLIYDLSDLLRKTVAMTQDFYIPVSEELHIVELYLRLQTKRFEDRLSYAINCDENCLQLAIPPLLLQPVIENAIKYAVAPYAKKSCITVAIYRKNKNLEIHIRDTGPKFSEQAVHPGTGLTILKKTLKNYYPGQYYMALKSTADGGHLIINLPMVPYQQGMEI